MLVYVSNNSYQDSRKEPSEVQFGQETIKFGSKGYGIKSREGYKNVPAGVTETD